MWGTNNQFFFLSHRRSCIVHSLSHCHPSFFCRFFRLLLSLFHCPFCASVLKFAILKEIYAIVLMFITCFFKDAEEHQVANPWPPTVMDAALRRMLKLENALRNVQKVGRKVTACVLKVRMVSVIDQKIKQQY